MSSQPRIDEGEVPSANGRAATGPEWVEAIAAEFTAGFELLAGLGPAVTVFGSARVPPSDPDYIRARAFSRAAGERGYATITGGGPGIMEAGNAGADDAGAESVGIGINLEFERGLNAYISRGMTCRYFFTRKVLLVRDASAFVCFPGGFGTLDELFEIATLRVTRKVGPLPIVLVGRDYWSGLVDWLKNPVAAEGKIDLSDATDLVLTDDLDEALERALAAPAGD